MWLELLWALPFAALLTSIAVFPLTALHWWEKHYAKVALGLAAIVAAHYLFQLRDAHSLVHTAHEYFSFICLIGSLFVVSGGIHITVKGEATPVVNCVFLLVGAVLANILGTTGASMVLIRPWMRMNKYRITAYHTVFFIFIISNVGGGLTPIGDPPLFLGYLKGVPFFWVQENVIHIWALTIGALVTIFFVIDSLNFRRAPVTVRQKETAHEEWRFTGVHNVFFLSMIIGSVFLSKPLFLREAIMIAAAILSYKFTAKSVHQSNNFSFAPIKEVAILFAGIFVTMLPALEWMEHNAGQLGIHSVGQFYWWSGSLSAVLDNAPTYLNFLSAALGLFGEPLTAHAAAAASDGKAAVVALLTSHPEYIKAISVASVFFGAVTYIGNGPNFLVKSIADQAKVKTPSFFGYFFKYSLPILLPIYFIVWWVFFSR